MLLQLVAASVLAASPALASTYDLVVLQDQPELYLPMNAPPGSQTEQDLSRHQRVAHYKGGSLPTKTRLRNGDRASVFDGATQYLEVTSGPRYSVPAGGALTIEALIRPDTLEFPHAESTGYVHFAGKGEGGQHEWALRMYSKTTADEPPRPNRISGYVFNPEGRKGSGSYFQDTVSRGAWIHVAVIIDQRPAAGAPTGTVSIYKNGVLRKVTPIAQFDVTPTPGTAPVRIGTRDFGSWFKGAIAKFALYDEALPAARIRAHFLALGE